MKADVEVSPTLSDQQPERGGADEQIHPRPALTTISTVGVVAAPIERVWQFVGDFAGVMSWHPSIKRCDADGSDVGAMRTLELGDMEVVERLDEWDAESHVIEYSVVVGRPQTIGLAGRIQLQQVADNETRVVWLTTMPDLPGAGDLVDGLQKYYATRLDHLRDAVSKSTVRKQGT